MGVTLTRRERQSMEFHASRQTRSSGSTISLSGRYTFLSPTSTWLRDSLEDIVEHGRARGLLTVLYYVLPLWILHDDGTSLIRREYPCGIPTRPLRVTPGAPWIIGQQSFRALWQVTRAVSARVKLPTHRTARTAVD